MTIEEFVESYVYYEEQLKIKLTFNKNRKIFGWFDWRKKKD